MNAFHNLTHIAKRNKKRLAATFALVFSENLLLLVYPVLGGFAINGVLAGNLVQALSYALLVLVIWMVGSARRAVDTRTFSRIYAEMVVPVIVKQRTAGQSTSTVAARVALSRELVDFFEHHLPTLVTSAFSIVGAVVMLLLIEFWSGVASLLILIAFTAFVPRYAGVNDRLYFRLNNRLEGDVDVIERTRHHHLLKHYGLLARLRIKISNREAAGYGIIGIALSLLFGISFTVLTLRGNATAGHLYAVVSYMWTFAMSIDDARACWKNIPKSKTSANGWKWKTGKLHIRHIIRPWLNALQFCRQLQQQGFVAVCGGELGADGQAVVPIKWDAHGGVAAHVERGGKADVAHGLGLLFGQERIVLQQPCQPA